MKSVKELRRAVAAANKTLNKAHAELHTALLAACEVHEGDIVVSTNGKWKGQEFRVVGVDVSFLHDIEDGERPWVAANPRRKDGTFGKAVRQLFRDWKKK